MEFDFSDLRAEVARYDAAYIRAGSDIGAYTMVNVFARSFADKIAVTLKPYLEQINHKTSPQLLWDMEFLYSKMISYAPALSLGHLVKGQFYAKCGDFDRAAECFSAAYNIERDPTRKTWPHLQATEQNAGIMIFLGASLYHSGQKEEGEDFYNAGQQMMEKFRRMPKENKIPEPL